MSARVTPLLSLLLVVGLAISAAAVRVAAQPNTDVYVESISIEGTTLTITGRNFGSAAPSVTVGESTAAVTSSSDTQIVAETTALAAGHHEITVQRDANAGGTAKSVLLVE
jgi:hypothetical protein